jgi:hypothetical protein
MSNVLNVLMKRGANFGKLDSIDLINGFQSKHASIGS